ncbi:MAG: hypothetical protein AAF725_10650 [Acidobacteriota bacterium]
MKARVRRWWPLGLLILTFALLWATASSPDARSSSLSRGPGGLWALRAYLEGRGVEVLTLYAPLFTAEGEGGGGGLGPEEIETLVLALPWQRPPSLELRRQLLRYLESGRGGAGGDLILAYDGRSRLDATEQLLLEILAVDPRVEPRPEPPLAPASWLAYRRAVWRLEAPASSAGRASTSPEPGRPAPDPPELEAVRFIPAAPAFGAEVDYVLPAELSLSGREVPLVFSFERQGSRITVLPAAALRNASIQAGGNLALVETLIARHGRSWTFDEYHHGLVRPELLERSAGSYAWDLFIAHLLLLYVLGLVAVGRRFGPVWRERRAHSGSTPDFLHHLGVLHHQLGHHRGAARQMLERARALRPSLQGADLDPEGVSSGADLVAFASRLEEVRAVAASRGPAPRTPGRSTPPQSPSSSAKERPSV